MGRAEECREVILENLTKKWAGTIIMVFPPGGGAPLVRYAAFVFDLKAGGFAWVEPSYLDPLGPSSPALHKRPGASVALFSERRQDLGASFVDDDTGERGMIYEWVRSDPPPVRELEAFEDALKELGTTAGAERERIRAEVSGA